MTTWKRYLAPILLAIIGVLFLLPTVKRVVRGEPMDGVAVTFLCLAVVFLGLAVSAGRKAAGGPGTPSG